jgi:hypothetical protein
MLIILFKSIDKYVTEENLFAKIDEIKLTEKEYEKIKQTVFATPDLEKLINQLSFCKEEDNLSTNIDKQNIFSEKGGAFVLNALKVELCLSRKLQLLL